VCSSDLATSHEHEEMITDPTGESWYDAIGQEEADKCVPPEPYEPLEAYGPPLGGSPGAQTAFNQLIDGHEYWLQTEWSNAAGEFQGGCVQRMVNVAFLPPTGAQASVPARFDGSASGAEGDQIVYWEWDFGDEAASGEFFSISAGPIASHTYALPGTYRVALTAVDALGNRNTTSRMVTVGQAPIPPSPPPVSPPPSTSTVTVATPTPAPIRLSATAVGAKLGLPRAGSQLAGLGTIALGHAACPPACGVTLGLYTTVLSTLHGHSISKQVRIGSLHTVIALGGAGTLALKLNAAGRALLRHAHRLRTILKVTVEDQQGATWQLSRPLTLTSPAHAARRRAR
jgi:hypothetical protein